MAFTKVTGPGINSTSNYKTNHINKWVVVMILTVKDRPFTEKRPINKGPDF